VESQGERMCLEVGVGIVRGRRRGGERGGEGKSGSRKAGA